MNTFTFSTLQEIERCASGATLVRLQLDAQRIEAALVDCDPELSAYANALLLKLHDLIARHPAAEVCAGT